ncbi:MAG: ribosomal protein S18-alanine N-acetyltransferase [Actinomycetota bacterium]|nr:ribosomal protein S18-alanine N-acetyltransferase [Actinomycetota bacterium]
MTIRAFADADVEAAVDLEANDRLKPWSARVFRDELAAENRVYLVAEDDVLVGFGGMMVVGEDAHVTNLLVSLPARRKGIGTRLMAALILAAIERGARHLTLEVRTRNHPARSLYAGFGLAPVGLRKGYYGDDDALVLWAHEIDSVPYRKKLEDMR